MISREWMKYGSGYVFGVVLWYIVPYLLVTFRDATVSNSVQDAEAATMNGFKSFRDTTLTLTSPIHSALESNVPFYTIYTITVYVFLTMANAFASYLFLWKRNWRLGVQFSILHLASLVINSIVWLPAAKEFVQNGNDFWHYTASLVPTREEAAFPARISWFILVSKSMEGWIIGPSDPIKWYHTVVHSLIVSSIVCYEFGTRSVYTTSVAMAVVASIAVRILTAKIIRRVVGPGGSVIDEDDEDFFYGEALALVRSSRDETDSVKFTIEDQDMSPTAVSVDSGDEQDEL